MSSNDNFDVFVGGKSGVFKGLKVGKKECAMKNIQNLVSITADDEVTTMAWADDEEKEILIACGRKRDRSVKVYDTNASTFTCSFLCNVGEGSINGISRYNGGILTAVHSGEVKLWRFKEDGEILLNAGDKLKRMRHSKVNQNIIATGGEENKLKLFDLEKQTSIFVEKDLPHDFLQLRIPVWISDIDFLPGTEEVVTAGRYGHVRLYDPKRQRRPVIKIDVKDEALTTLGVTPREKQIIVGSGRGRMNLIDLRSPGKILNTYKGCVGGVRGIACSTKEPYVVSVGLDRYLQVHDINTKKLLRRVYLTSKMSCMVMRSEFSMTLDSETNNEGVQELQNNENGGEKETENSQDADSDSEYDMIFENMQVVGSKKSNKSNSNKRRKIVSNVSSDEAI